MNTIVSSRFPGSAAGGISTPFGTTSKSQPLNHAWAELRASFETAIRWSIRSSRAPQKCTPACIHPSRPAACQVATTGHRATASADTQIAGVIGSCMWRTSKRSSAKTRFSLKGTVGLRQRFGSEPLAGTITVRPTGMTSGGGSSWRPWRGCSARVKVPGGSFPITILTSWPRARSASDLSSACSSTAPQNDHENGTTMPTFIPWEPSDWAVCSVRVRGGPRGAAHPSRRLGGFGDPVEHRARAGDRTARQGLLGVRPPGHSLRPARRPRPERARRDLPLDRADPVEPARGRAIGARGDRRRLPVAADHDARAALQPDEAEPGRRARPRPHHHGRRPWPRPREPRVPAGPRRPDPDDGPHLRRAAEPDHRREGDPVPLARHRRDRHRRTSPRRLALPLRAAQAARRRRPRRRPRRDHPRRRGGRRPRHRGDRRGDRGAQPGSHRPRDPRRPRSPS